MAEAVDATASRLRQARRSRGAQSPHLNAPTQRGDYSGQAAPLQHDSCF